MQLVMLRHMKEDSTNAGGQPPTVVDRPVTGTSALLIDIAVSRTRESVAAKGHLKNTHTAAN